mgnify:CR=1 FL=1
MAYLPSISLSNFLVIIVLASKSGKNSKVLFSLALENSPVYAASTTVSHVIFKLLSSLYENTPSIGLVSTLKFSIVDFE